MRLHNSECSSESGGIFLSIVSNLERVADHFRNVFTSMKSYVSPVKVKANVKEGDSAVSSAAFAVSVLTLSFVFVKVAVVSLTIADVSCGVALTEELSTSADTWSFDKSCKLSK